MALAVLDRPLVGRDPVDHRGVWAHLEGDELVPGVQAWRRLATGLRCETWLGWDVAGWHPVVVKLARPHEVDNPRAWANLTREVYVLSRATHPALPRLHADHTDAAVPYVIMEHVDGPTLADVVDDQGPLDPGSVVLLGGALLAALLAVHATGAAHLDVKSENVLLRDGRPVLIDFGSARPLGSSQPVGLVLGTEGYAAPELEAGQPVTAAMDVYGVGMVLAEALRGCPGRRRTHARGELSRIVAQLTAADPADRPSVTGALLLLDRAAGGTLAPPWLPRP